MDRDGTKSGFDLELLRAVTDAVRVPVIASGGAGTADHLADGVLEGHASAVLAASIFHFGELRIADVKRGWPNAAWSSARCERAPDTLTRCRRRGEQREHGVPDVLRPGGDLVEAAVGTPGARQVEPDGVTGRSVDVRR